MGVHGGVGEGRACGPRLALPGDLVVLMLQWGPQQGFLEKLPPPYPSFLILVQISL